MSMVIGGVGLFLIEYYVEHYDRFNDNKAQCYENRNEIQHRG